jgi:hypothetical protein
VLARIHPDRWRSLVVLSLFAVIGMGCTGPQHSAAPSLPHGPAKTAALAAYRAWWSDYAAATRSFPVDPSTPRLELHMQTSELTKIQSQLAYMKTRQQYIKGPVVDTTRAEVTALTSNSATITDCYLDLSYLVNGVTGSAENQPDMNRILARASLDLVNGQWKVASFVTVKIGCTSAS